MNSEEQVRIYTIEGHQHIFICNADGYHSSENVRAQIKWCEREAIRTNNPPVIVRRMIDIPNIRPHKCTCGKYVFLQDKAIVCDNCLNTWNQKGKMISKGHL